MDSKLSSDNLAEYFLDNQNISKEEEYSCYLCNATYERDLQLAAELGKSLLERNKQLETALKNHQNIIDDQAQEIEYLAKKSAALNDVNSSRIKIYEQIEISIQELENSNETLSRQALNDKNQIKSLHETIEAFEVRVEELQNSLDRVSVEYENEKRQRITSAETNVTHANETVSKRNSTELCPNCSNLTIQLQESKSSFAKDQKLIKDFREQLAILIEENKYLQEQLDLSHKKDEEIKKLQEELATFEQIRLGNFCKRCLRSTIPAEDQNSADEISLVMADEEERKIAQSIVTSLIDTEKAPSLEGHSENPYRMLVEKYEALLKMQEQQNWIRTRTECGHVSTLSAPNHGTCMSLRDELQLSGNFYDNCKKEMTDSELEEEPEVCKQRLNTKVTHPKSVTTSPCFVDNVLHKGTQTEMFAGSLPGSFLCRISDGNDCQFSIYDNASPVESRFRKTPEYRQLFKEIFAVLKRAAEAKDEGESLPLLDDKLPCVPMQLDAYQHQPKVPPVTPAREEQFFVSVEDEKWKQSQAAEKTEIKSETVSSSTKNGVEKKVHSDVMQKLMDGVKPKRNTSKGERRAVAAVHRTSPSPSPAHSRSSSKRRANSKARRKYERLTDSPNRSRERYQQKSNKPVEILNNLEIFEKMTEKKEQLTNDRKLRPVSMFAYSSGNSSASQDVAKLKILEKSYAEVLRMGRKKGSGGW